MLLNWFEPEYVSVLPEMLILTVLALIISSIGFYRMVYFISIGYAFSIVAMAVMTPVIMFVMKMRGSVDGKASRI